MDDHEQKTLTPIEQFELDRANFAKVAKETGMFEVIAEFAKYFGRIPSASITTEDGTNISYCTPSNVIMPQIGNKPKTDAVPPEPPKNVTKIVNNYSRARSRKHY
ncbi:hypothetical protein C5F64_13865 [Photobacterium damselae subsp. damselae]|uniref:hypothetical protein n=1 Tax=Photobacterium damselae TaxID=38293 RepID=UPI000D05EACC|nr:hypothetical protein [Photobacterium damselae]PSB84128.1 hypothetical protein C5F64_13865 [Photobacterium damselae subsp. damselae]